MLISYFFYFVNTPRTAAANLPTSRGFVLAILACIALTISALVHELGRRFAAMRAGGRHETLILWPLGGMQGPSFLPTPNAMIFSNLAGSGANLLFSIVVAAILLPFGISVLMSLPGLILHALDPSVALSLSFMPYAGLSMGAESAGELMLTFALMLVSISLGMGMIQLWPIYFLDGGYVLEGILSHFLALTRAQYLAATTGMLLASGLFIFEVWRKGGSIIMFALLFFTCFMRWRAASASGGADPDWSGYSEQAEKPKRKKKRNWFSNRWAKAAVREAQRNRKEQSRIDAILAKVHERGLHSLTWWEKRALKKATERQRQQDLAEKL